MAPLVALQPHLAVLTERCFLADADHPECEDLKGVARTCLEPGPEVTAVRDRRGHRWTRHPDYPGDWEAKHITDENGCYPTDRLDAWGELLAWFGPVTDATWEA